MRVFENKVLRRIFGLKGRKWREAGEDCIMRSFVTCTLYKILLRLSNQGEWDVRGT
jgi:hypothetical protein